MNETGELARWLSAQLDKNERIARAAAAVRGPVWWYEGYFGNVDGQVLAGDVLDGGSAAVRSLAMTTRSDAQGEHAAWHDPDRVLREIDAKRQILALHAATPGYVHGDEDDDPACRMCGDLTVRFPCRTVRLLALPYADRPGYREEWRP